MTLVLAGKYRNGILVAYDMVTGGILEDGRVLVNSLTDKARPIWNGQSFVGIAGRISATGTIEDLMQEIDKAQVDETGSSIRKVLNRMAAADSEASVRFVLGSFNGHSRLIVNDQWFGSEEVDYCGIGDGYYPTVEQMVAENYSPNYPLSYIMALFHEAMLVARTINQDRNERLPLIGMGLAKLTKDGFGIIERRKH